MNMADMKMMALLAAFAIGASAHAAPVSGQGTWETTLKARDINGDMVVDAYYDTALDITWLADWNANGLMDWNTAVAWATALDVHGVVGWRLPTVTDYGNDGCDFGSDFNSGGPGKDCGYNVDTTGSELAHMFYVTLGNKAYCPPGDATCSGGAGIGSGFGLTNTANFQNMQSDFYWFGKEYVSNPSVAWVFDTLYGYQIFAGAGGAMYAVAVRPGDVSMPTTHSVPEPQAFGLMLTGVGALTLLRRRRLRTA